MNARFEVEKFNDYAVIHLIGAFHSGENDFPKELKKIIKDLSDESFKKILINFEKVSFFGSDGIGALTNGHYTVTNLGGRLVPYALPQYIKTAFTLVGLDKIFPNYANKEEALDYLNNQVK